MKKKEIKYAISLITQFTYEKLVKSTPIAVTFLK